MAFAIGATAFAAEGRFELPGFVWLLSLVLAIAGTLLSITGLVCLVGRIWMAVLAFVLSLGYWAIVGYGFCQMLGNL